MYIEVNTYKLAVGVLRLLHVNFFGRGNIAATTAFIRKLQSGVFLFQDHSVHPVDWTVIVAAGEELFALDCTGDNIADEWVSLRQVCRKIHLLPLEALADSESREPEV